MFQNCSLEKLEKSIQIKIKNVKVKHNILNYFIFSLDALMAQVVSDLASSPLDVSHLLCFIQSALCSSLSIAFQGFMLA